MTTKAPHKLPTYLATIAKYLLLFLVIYGAVNYYRQPIMPITDNLVFVSHLGETLDLAKQSQDKPILVYFWGTWCGVCTHTSPTINQLAQDKTGQVVSIAIQSGNNDELNAYMQNKGYQFVVINDDAGQIFKAWQGQVTPSYVIIKNGKITQGFTGLAPLWSLKLRLAWASLT